MLPDIGVMVGFYVVMRCAEMFGRKGDRAVGVFVKIAATATIIVSVICTLDLFLRGNTKT